MNKTYDGANYGFTQYCYARDYELSGRNVTLRMPEGRKTLCIKDREFIEYSDSEADKVLS